MEIASGRLLFAALLCLSSCQGDTLPRTEILLVVDSDLQVPGQLDRLDVHVEGPGGLAQDSHADLDAAESGLPRSVALVHEGGPLGPLHATVQGLSAGRVVLTRQARLAFVAGKTLVLPMHLVARCIGVECGAQTCGELGCANVDIDPLGLASYTGAEPRLSTDDAGGAAFDAGSAHDAGSPDAATAGDSSVRDGGVAQHNDGGSGDAGVKRDAGMCLPALEVCNALDDDCDGQIDNGFDLTSDPNHCGACATRCTGVTRRCCTGVCRSGC